MEAMRCSGLAADEKSSVGVMAGGNIVLPNGLGAADEAVVVGVVPGSGFGRTKLKALLCRGSSLSLLASSICAIVIWPFILCCDAMPPQPPFSFFTDKSCAAAAAAATAAPFKACCCSANKPGKFGKFGMLPPLCCNLANSR